VSELFRAAGFKAPVLTDIRSEIWLKLWGNATFNPISALTHATLEDICRFLPTRDLAARTMTEIQAIGAQLGVQFRVPMERRLAGAEAVGRHKTSMLQDVEAGRALELDALVGAVVELGRLTGIPTPNLDAIFACASLLARTLQSEGGRLRLEAR
jgi:2-dehydropantoate 2-reductase